MLASDKILKKSALLGLTSFLLSTGALSACAGTVTPPDTTPVYADDAIDGIEAVDVEHSSINDPEVKTRKTAGTEEAEPKAPASDAPASEEATTAEPSAPEAEGDKPDANEEKPKTEASSKPAAELSTKSGSEKK